MARHDVVFLNRFYWPDHSATAQMLTDLAEDLAAAGWDVTVLTSRARYDGEPMALPRRETHRGVQILRVGARGGSRHSTLGRLWGYLRYVAGAARVLLTSPRWEAVVAMSDPPLLVVLATMVARVRRRKTIYWVQDVFPQIAEQLGAIRPGGFVSRVTRALSRRANARCDLVVALGDRMADAMRAAGATAERTVVVHNWADGALVRPVPADGSAFARQHDLKGRFVVMYSGNAGRAHPLESYVDAAARLPAEQFAFVCIGGGARIAALRARAERLGAKVRFLDYVPREALADSLGAASVSVVAEDPAVSGLLVPSKLYGILASGRPVVLLGSEASDVADVVRTAECGWIVAPGDVDGLVKLLMELREDPQSMERAGVRARAAFESSYERRIATAKWAEAVGHTLSATNQRLVRN